MQKCNTFIFLYNKYVILENFKRENAKSKPFIINNNIKQRSN